MTLAQSDESAHRPEDIAIEVLNDRLHDAHNHEKTNMSGPGPKEHAALTSQDEPGEHSSEHVSRRRSSRSHPSSIASELTHVPGDFHLPDHPTASRTPDPFLSPIITYGDLAKQLRRQRNAENRWRLLQGRKRALQRIIALSARLHRIGSWVRDGLVEISNHGSSDPTSFVRAHRHMQNLIDWSYSQWNLDLHALDSIEMSEMTVHDSRPARAFYPRLSGAAKSDLLALLTCLRSNSKFLVERFKTLQPAQITALSTVPTLVSPSESAMSIMYQAQTRRVKAYGRALEDYASSFERSNPLAFLLFNIYGTAQSLTAPENQLRLCTWSTVCAELFVEHKLAYNALWPALTSSFASIHEWPLKDTMELFLMEVLQNGAFLLDDTSRQVIMPGDVHVHNTEQAHEFFEKAILDLFAMLVDYDGGYPTGAIRFAAAVVGKLPSVKHQMDYRGDFFSKWFLDRFLKVIITHPENENMLLKFHISNEARKWILLPLFNKIDQWVMDVYNPNPIRPVHPAFAYYVNCLVGKMDGLVTHDPYRSISTTAEELNPPENPLLAVCATEILQVLEALSPHTIQGTGVFDRHTEKALTDCASAFQAQYSHASDRFDHLKRELLFVIEPGSSSSEIHACKEQWLELEINVKGELNCVATEPNLKPQGFADDARPLDLVQHAALRVYEDYASDVDLQSSTIYRTEIFNATALATLFYEKAKSAGAHADPISRMYWERASQLLRVKYPLSGLAGNDTPVLRALVTRTLGAYNKLEIDCACLQQQISMLEDVSGKIRATVSKLVESFDGLKLKMWYSTSVINSIFYENARNITRALTNMAQIPLKPIVSSRASTYSGRRSGSSLSAASSVFSLSVDDTMGILKAPSQHGGPKKLADKQIENTKKWLQMSSVENFCKGEERIHRFCMEVAQAAKNLVGENLSDAPDLWASELFARESNYFDIHSSMGSSSAPASTRPASVVSDTQPAAYRGARPPFRSSDSARTAATDDRRSRASKIDKAFLHPDLASSIGSPGRAFSATTAESISTFWSALPSHARSMTSASVYSRPPSSFNDHSMSRIGDTGREKQKFLLKARQALVCLLLSDLGCPVWSLGSETDAWMSTIRLNDRIDRRLECHATATTLLGNGQMFLYPSSIQARARRSNSASGRIFGTAISPAETPNKHDDEEPDNTNPESQNPRDDFVNDLAQLLTKLSQVVDPFDKLQVVGDLHDMSLAQLRVKLSKIAGVRTVPAQVHSSKGRRRNSVNGSFGDEWQNRLAHAAVDDHADAREPSEAQVVNQLTTDLIRLNPKTLFRDLQYIAAFVPSEVTSKTSLGTAFLRLGLAAFAYKDEVCDTMVEVADRLVARDSIKRLATLDPPENTIMKVAEYWMIAAREGHKVAQRELATLYLTHPRFLPIMTLPLSESSGIFRDEMLWHERNEANSSTQALCLAVHWMQLAAKGGDALAQQKLDERRGRISIP